MVLDCCLLVVGRFVCVVVCPLGRALAGRAPNRSVGALLGCPVVVVAVVDVVVVAAAGVAAVVVRVAWLLILRPPPPPMHVAPVRVCGCVFWEGVVGLLVGCACAWLVVVFVCWCAGLFVCS